MPIAALPPQTISAIGSNSALSDPAALVKELIDNAIDGKATSISVEIAANTLDDIRVRDNGSGIAPMDRPLICRRHCTSKIRDFEELQNLGGRSLGFRGVALASVAEMSGCLTISTRIEGEETASELKFDRQGQIISGKPVSLPAGTLVRVERFLQPLPVRKQAMEKASAKTLAKLKKIFQSYAFCRPYLKLLLKVMKAKNDKDNFKFPLVARTGHMDHENSNLSVATQIVGKRVVDQCQWRSSVWSSSGEQVDGAIETLAETYKFEAVLAKCEYDPSIISNAGNFLSVDSRPVSNSRGIFKKIVTAYKTHICSLIADVSEHKTKDPFLYLNIACPVGAYDVNVEPAKDDVLFSDTELVLEFMKKFLVSIYGEVHIRPEKPTTTTNRHEDHSIDLMLARKPSAVGHSPVAPPWPTKSPSTELPHPLTNLNNKHRDRLPLGPRSPPALARGTIPDEQSLMFSHEISHNPDGARARSDSPNEVCTDNSHDVPCGGSPSSARAAWKTAMYAGDEEDGSENDLAESAADVKVDDEEAALASVHVSNPWAFAKLHAPFRPPRQCPRQSAEQEANPQLPTPARQLGDAGSNWDPSSSTTSPFPYPLKARGKRRADETVNEGHQPSIGDRSGRGSVDTWVQKTTNWQHSDSTNTLSDDEAGPRGTRGPPDLPRLDPFVSARTLPMGTPLSDIPDISQRPRNTAPRRKPNAKAIEKPSIAPVHDLERVWFDTGETPKRRRPQNAGQTPKINDVDVLNLRDEENEESRPPQPPEGPVHPDLAEALDYEFRKQRVNQMHRESLRRQKPSMETAQEASPPSSSPHKNRQRAAIAALHTNDQNQTNLITSTSYNGEVPAALPSNDPRAYLIHLAHPSNPQTTSEPRKLKRHKTALLPFETVTEDRYIGDLMQIIPTTTPTLSTKIQQMLPLSGFYDDYIHDGIVAGAFDISDDQDSRQDVDRWEETLKAMVKKQYRIEGMRVEEEMDGDLDVDLWGVLHGRESSPEVV